MKLKMIRQAFVVVVLLCSSCLGSEYSSRDVQSRVGRTLSTFRKVSRTRQDSSDGSYSFSFSLPDHERAEERTADGEVEGSFAFLAPEGEEISLKYDAGQNGFRPESKSLPVGPNETDDVQNAREAHLKLREETISYLKALGAYNEEQGYAVEPESREEVRSRAVTPKSREGYNRRVEKAEPQRAVKARVIKPESQEKVIVRVVRPKAREGYNRRVVKVESNEEVKPRVVKPKTREEYRRRVVKPESEEEVRVRVVRPESREGFSYADDDEDLEGAESHEVEVRVVKPKSREDYRRTVVKAESSEEVKPRILKPKTREEYMRLVKPESEEDVRVRVVKPESREGFSYADDDEDLEGAESHEVEVRVVRPKSREDYRRRVVKPESVEEVKARVVKPVRQRIVEIKKVEVVVEQEEEEDEEEEKEEEEVLEHHEHHEHEHEQEHKHEHEPEHEEELPEEVTDEDLEAAYNANVFESGRHSVFNRITPKALQPSTATSAPETNYRTRAPRITQIPKISGPYFQPIRK